MPGRATRARRPHVLVIVQNLPLRFDRRVRGECRTLIDAGYDVTVICPRAPGSPASEVLDGVQVRSYRPAPPTHAVAAYLVEFTYAWLRTAALAWRVFLEHRFDAIQACNPPDTYFALAWLFRPFGVQFVFDHHDLCPELFRTQRPQGGLLLAGLELLERQTYRTASRVIATNDSYAAIARQRHGADVDITVVRSGPDPAVMRRTSADPALRRGRRHLCCYVGIMGPQDGVDVAVRAADVLVHERGRDDCSFALLGDGDCFDELRALAHALELDDWVEFTGMAGPDQLARYLSTADVGISPDLPSPFNDVSTMNKTLEYMAFEVAVVSFDLTEARRSAGEAASYVSATGDRSEDVHRFADAIAELLDDPLRRARMGRAGREAIEAHLGWHVQSVAYRSVWDGLLAGAPTPRPVAALAALGTGPRPEVHA